MKTENEKNTVYKVVLKVEERDLDGNPYDYDSARRRARELSELGMQKEFEPDTDSDDYLWLGVRWAALAWYADEGNDRKYVVIASVRVPEDSTSRIWEQEFRGGNSPPAENQEYVGEQPFKGGAATAWAKDGMP